MTPKEKQLKDYISLYWEENGFAPSYRDMMEGTGVSSTSLPYTIAQRLVKKGYLELIPYSSNRNLKPVSSQELSALAFLEQRGLTQDYQQWSNT